MDKINPKLLTYLVITDIIQKLSKIQKNLSFCKDVSKVTESIKELKKECEKIENKLNIDSFDAQFAKMILRANKVTL